MGEKPTAEDDAARHSMSMSSIGNIRGREAQPPPEGQAAAPGDPIPDIDAPTQRSAGAPLKGVDVKLA